MATATLATDQAHHTDRATTNAEVQKPSSFAILLKSGLALTLLTIALPLNLAIVLPCWLFASVRRRFRANTRTEQAAEIQPEISGQDSFSAKRPSGCFAKQSSDSLFVPKSVLISGGKMTKALQLARSFHAAGHRVVLCETSKYAVTGHRFSNAVDKFCVVDEPTSPNYAESLRAIVRGEKIDVYVPVCSPLASRYDSAAVETLQSDCEVLHPHPSIIDQLDNKYQFAKTAESFGLLAPKSFVITDPRQVIDFDFSTQTRPFILKSIPYDAIRRLDLTKLPGSDRDAMIRFVRSLPISPEKPWVMQEFIAGEEFCTHSTVVGGQLRLHCCCRSSAFQINYQHIDQPDIERWVQTFVSRLNVTGQASFDFIRADDDGQIYAIECNPRTHSAITTFYDHAGVADAYLRPNDSQTDAIVKPHPSAKPTHWIYHELGKLACSLTRPKELLSRIKRIAKGKDAIFDINDPLPFLMVHHYQIPMLLIDDLRHRKGWKRIDFNIGKLVQWGGD